MPRSKHFSFDLDSPAASYRVLLLQGCETTVRVIMGIRYSKSLEFVIGLTSTGVSYRP